MTGKYYVMIYCPEKHSLGFPNFTQITDCLKCNNAKKESPNRLGEITIKCKKKVFGEYFLIKKEKRE